ncbi:spore cortex-lytic enzyme [Bacillus horti]|uniref:Spore cortex-lytic enzyme n=1 Tax=Caldalkalibacillus horti TaxID=77523 RepID=A0ABT9VWT0_9BACI|nr:spore cortex-lytic enzyme [Bacillus horti]MDQ0165457.1 N-acetylmuramoyl-L-alanine amidase [Bacillus horti]
MQFNRTWKISMALLLIISSILAFPVQDIEATGQQLKQGDRNGYVWDLQHRLQQLGYYKFALDGLFGYHTKEAVMLFQSSYGLVSDGVVGEQTWNTLRRHTYTQDEIEMLAKVVYGEARGEPFEGKVAVAAVVLNRIAAGGFPDTVKEVIFQPRAFTAVDDGQYYMTPDRDAYRAVYNAIQGWDPSGGALYYFNPQTATSSWIWSRTQMGQIGKHVFAY